MQDAQAGVFCLWRMQSQCLSQELKKVRHVCVSQLGKTQCLTKLRHVSHQAEKGETTV